MAAATALFLLLLATPVVFATDYTVGDNSGWDTGVVYSAWTSGKTFKVGDNLIFTYTTNHKVDVVPKSAYDSCSSSNTLQSFGDGNTTFPLANTGPYYFLCPTGSHCSQGMKLSVTVAASATPTPTPTTPTTPPTATPSTPSTPSGTPSPPSSSGTPSSPGTPPAGSGASSRFQELSGLALGASLMWGALVALMG